MAGRYRRLREISRFLPRAFPGNYQNLCTLDFHLSAFSSVHRTPSFHIISALMQRKLFDVRRISTVSEVLTDSQSEVEVGILSFIQSSFKELEGPHHVWLNKSDADKSCPWSDKTPILLAQLFDNSSLKSCQAVSVLRKLKSIQKRYPHLYVMGFQSGSRAHSSDCQTLLAQLMIKEHVIFPILLTSRSFSEIAKGPCFILCKDTEHPLFFREELDLETIGKAVEDINKLDEFSESTNTSKSMLLKQNDSTKEPHLSTIIRNLLLSCPASVSADEDSGRLFLSDSSHHRIIISDARGKILDCIGSSPGFEDGDFESAKLLRPASSFYHAEENCLYIADSENHAIRRADMRRRLIETIYPQDYSRKKTKTFWSWIIDMFGFQRQHVVESKTLSTDMLLFPWHIMPLADDRLLVISQSFETLWILDLSSGEIKEIVQGFQKIMEFSEELILEKVLLLKQMPRDWLLQQTLANLGEILMYNSLISSVTSLGKHIILCDTVGHRVLKYNMDSGKVSNLKLSNFMILGLPYWLACPLERVCAVGDGLHETTVDHVQNFSLLPGRVNISLHVDIPVDTELVEPVQDGSIWRQARGAATEVLGAEGVVGSADKVGVSQQWYDELDNLAFTVPESESVLEDDDIASHASIEDKKVRIDCVVNTSPGTSEVVIYAALYLRLRRDLDLLEDGIEKYARTLADLLVPKSSGKMGRDLCHQILLKANIDLRDVTFVKPLHVRIKLDSLNHPKADNKKDILLTDSSIEVNVSL